MVMREVLFHLRDGNSGTAAWPGDPLTQRRFAPCPCGDPGGAAVAAGGATACSTNAFSVKCRRMTFCVLESQWSVWNFERFSAERSKVATTPRLTNE